MKKMKIILGREGHLFKAWLEGQPGVSETGQFSEQAVGNLIIKHAKKIGINVETTEGEQLPFPPSYYEPGVGG